MLCSLLLPLGSVGKANSPDAAGKTDALNASGKTDPLATASDVDRMSEHPYVTSRPDCSAHLSLTDPLKDLVLPIEQVARELTQLTAADEAALGAEALALLPGQFDGKLIEQGTTVGLLSFWDISGPDALALSLVLTFSALVWVVPGGLWAWWRQSSRRVRPPGAN